MNRISRRDLLRGGIAAGAVAVGGVIGGEALSHGRTARAIEAERADTVNQLRRLAHRNARRAPGSLPFPDLPAGTDTMPEIEHILVLMQENHSYDNYLGMLGRGAGQTPRGDGFTIGANGLPTAANPYPNGSIQHAFHMPTDCQVSGGGWNGWTTTHTAWAGGAMDGFVAAPPFGDAYPGATAMGYWTETDLPFYYSLASTFPLADRWFSSVLGPTYPNRRYLIGATSLGLTSDDLSQLSTQPPNGTIFDELDHYGIPWRDYYHNQPTTGIYLADPASTSPDNVSFESFFTDCAAGTLPGFAIIDPNFNNASEENPSDIARGEAWSSSAINAVMSSPAWSKTLLVWTYDEGGGYYDHVPPPAAIPPDAVAPVVPPGHSLYNGFAQSGIRVPAVVISPFAKPDFVSSVVHDHTSILSMVERKWNLPALTYRDANANDLMDFIDRSRPSFAEPPLLAAPASFPQACSATGPGQIPPAGSISTPS